MMTYLVPFRYLNIHLYITYTIDINEHIASQLCFCTMYPINFLNDDHGVGIHMNSSTKAPKPNFDEHE